MRNHRCRFNPLPGPTILLDGRYFSGAREMYCRRVYFAIEGFEIRPEDVVVDLGANAGLFTTMAAVHGTRVIAVEAQSRFHPEIDENLRQNGCAERVALELALVGAETGVLSRPDGRRQASHWGEEPTFLQMPELFHRHGLTAVNLLKVDIEGSEFDLFRGDLEWLAAVDRIVMEVHPAFGSPDELLEVLWRSGFGTTVLDSEGRPSEGSKLSERGGYVFARRT